MLKIADSNWLKITQDHLLKAFSYSFQMALENWPVLPPTSHLKEKKAQ